MIWCLIFGIESDYDVGVVGRLVLGPLSPFQIEFKVNVLNC
jgi:hypothetical protein